ncbi:MAG: hypothetical protein GXX91_15750 [Verrucomicrobiaceae bacterium]|nr:hypothetical protein [Verrucomicrobiaceae bacterium]
MRFPRVIFLSACSAFAVAVAGLCSGGALAAQESGTEESVEVRELRAALLLSRNQLAAERERGGELEEQRQVLIESLAEAVRVSEEQMAAARETKLKLEAFGVDLFTQENNSLEQRLLKAVRDLDIAQQEIERQSGAIRQLSEHFMKVLQSAPELTEAQRTEAEAAIAEAGRTLADPAAGSEGEQDISKAKVVSIDSGVGLVVFDAGRGSGVRIGTPITVTRGDRPIYSAMIVDVRESISGAVLQDRMADAGEVEVGDGIRLLPEQKTL